MSASDRQPRIARLVRSCIRATQLAPAVSRFTLVLEYDPADPLVVRLVIDGVNYPWVVGRDLLADGMKGHVGYGDVRLWPVETAHGACLHVVLAPPSGQALLELPRAEVQRFLDRAYRQVPRGAELHLIDLDQLVIRLLTETP